MDAENPPRMVYRFDRFTLDLARGTLLTSDGAELPLRPKSFALLQFLVENARRLLDRDSIMQAVWPDVFVTDDSITQCIRDIRRTLGDEAQRLLRTMPRRGYLLDVQVSHTGPAMAVIEALPRSSAGQQIAPAPPLAPFQHQPGQGCRDDMPDDAVGYPQGGVPSSTLRSPIQHAIAENDVDRSQSPPAQDQTEPSHFLSSPGAETPVSSPGAERRQVTVLFCDLVGSTALSEQLDPEDFGGVVHVYRELCAGEIARHGGYVASCMSEGVLAYFGYPHAREDAAEQAVRASLAIVEAASSLKSDRDLTLQVRAGIDTGLVVNHQVDESAQSQVTVGKPLNLATRLPAIAEPGTVVISKSTRRLLGELFALEDLGSHSLKGFTAPAEAWRVTSEGVAESRFEALRGTRLTPLVGRRQELTLLLDRWDQAQEGEGQVVLIAGEAGIGKSRLVQAVRDRLADGSHIHLGYYCSPHRRNSPLRPVIAQLERAGNFSRGDDPGQKLAKLEALLVQGDEEVARVAPLIASLLSIPSGGRYPPLNMSPHLQRERTLAALVGQLAGLAARRPVLLDWEDVHWADPSSLELLELVIDRLQSLPVLALVTFRPEFGPPWPGHTHVTRLTLNRLGRRRCGRLVAEVTGGKSLPAGVLDQIVDRAEGVPLFVEELTRAVLESGLLREEAEGGGLESPLPPVAVPATLQDSLMARLDRVAPVKEIAQVAAVIGREFSHELVAAILSREEEELAHALRQLIAAELVFRRGTLPETTYVFKHALVRDAAYASLLKDRRQQLHARIAQVLEERFAKIVEAEPDVLARHWTEAGDAEKAANYRLKAGQRALAHSATAEAVAQLETGEKILQSLPATAERQRMELDLQIALGTALGAARGLAAPGTAYAYARARQLCGELGEQRRLIPVLLGLWASHNARDELGAARAVAAQLLQVAEDKRDGAARILAHRALGATLFGLGEFAAARTHLQQLLALDRPTAAGHSPTSLPYDPCVSGRAWLALTLAVLGYPEQAIAQADEALAEAGRLRHHNTTALVLSLRCSVGQFLRDHDDVARHTEALLALAVQQDFAYWVGLGMYFQGWSRAGAGEIMAGIEEMRQALAACQSTGAQAYVPYNLALLADRCRQADDAPQARKLLDEALDRLGRTDACYAEAELLRIDGEVRLAISPPDWNLAETCFRRAIEVAHRQDAKTAELRAAMSLARMWADHGQQRQAYDLLVPIYGWFTEGFDTTDLKEAKALLDELG
jgi:predicted ATPase/class 3 adenylate cyclase/DNA-binding winged helix-turn-helix (wHTH) protein